MAKQLEYLRPVSPLHYEPIEPLPHQTYLDDDSSSEDDFHRQAKRRRIEKIGERYLRGLPVVISTASLRGPFHKDWHNPWSKREKSTGRGLTSKEVPETVQRLGFDGSKPSDQRTTNQKPTIVEGNIGAVTAPTVVRSDEGSNTCRGSKTTRPSEYVAVDDPFKTNPAQRSKTKVEDWLKKDNGILRPRTPADAEGPQSPTARFTAINSRKKHADTGHQQRLRGLLLQRANKCGPSPENVLSDHSVSEDRSPARVEILTAADALSEKRHKVPRILKEKDRDFPIQSNNAELVGPTEKEAQLTHSDCGERSVEHDAQPRQWKSRAAAYRRSLHALSPSTNLPDFEYRPVKQSGKSSTQCMGLNDPVGHYGMPKSVERDSALSVSGCRPPDQLPVKDSGKGLEQNKANSENVNELVTARAVPQSNSDIVLQKQIPTLQPHCSPTRQPINEKAEVDIVCNTNKMMPPPPSLTTETSNKSDTTITTNHLPSAQVLPQQQNPTLAPSLPSIDLETVPKINENGSASNELNVEDSIFLLSTQEAVAKAQEKFHGGVETPSNGQTASTTPDKPVKSTVLPSPTGKITPLQTFPRREQVQSVIAGGTEPDTQAALDAATPFAFSTTKKIPISAADVVSTKGTESQKPPIKQTRKKKKASFAVDTQISSGSSEGSIKDIMKIQKGRTGVGLSKEFLVTGTLGNDEDEPPRYRSPGPDMETSVEDISEIAKLTMVSTGENFQASSKGRPSSTEKRRPEQTASTLPLTSNTEITSLSSAQQHDAQQRTPLADGLDVNPTLDEDGQGFDLDAALADMGSFLQTWDAEKEATSLASSSAKEGTSSKSSSWRVRTRASSGRDL